VSISVAANAHFITEDKQLEPHKLSASENGTRVLGVPLIYTIGMLPGGYLIDRVGPRWAMTGMGLGLGLWAAITGILGWTGLTIAAMFVAAPTHSRNRGGDECSAASRAARSVSLWVPLKERSTANGADYRRCARRHRAHLSRLRRDDGTHGLAGPAFVSQVRR